MCRVPRWGAIIAGLYAIGYTPEQMAEIFESNQIKYWMSGKIEDKYIYYFKQRRPNAANDYAADRFPQSPADSEIAAP